MPLDARPATPDRDPSASEETPATAPPADAAIEPEPPPAKEPEPRPAKAQHPSKSILLERLRAGLRKKARNSPVIF